MGVMNRKNEEKRGLWKRGNVRMSGEELPSMPPNYLIPIHFRHFRNLNSISGKEIEGFVTLC